MITVLAAALTALALSSPPALAQYGRHDRDRDFPRERPMTHADSTRSLEGPRQLWFHAGMNGLAAPDQVRPRYVAGLDVGVAGDVRAASRVALRARIGYADLPSRRSTFLAYQGSTFGNGDSGHGWMGSALLGVALRAWDHLWLEGGGGGAYFRSGLPATILDLNTGRILPVPGSSGNGGAWLVAARYEFQPRQRDRMFVEPFFLQMNRAGLPLSFWAVRVGYRAF